MNSTRWLAVVVTGNGRTVADKFAPLHVSVVMICVNTMVWRWPATLPLASVSVSAAIVATGATTAYASNADGASAMVAAVSGVYTGGSLTVFPTTLVDGWVKVGMLILSCR